MKQESMEQSTNHQLEALLLQPDKRLSKGWIGLFALASALLCVGGFGVYNTFKYGLASWGLNNSIGWGWGITNFIWCIGIGHAGTFISAILLLFRQNWRSSIARLAETMTIISIFCAGIYPILHLGRPEMMHYIFPYLNSRNLWVNFQSPLLWDLFAISTYLTVSFLFWYTGLIPDIYQLSLRSSKLWKRKLYGLLHWNWQPSEQQWERLKTLHFYFAVLSTPLVISVHTIVSFDFATSIIPGWHSTLFPPYFVIGAIFSGFAMVQVLSIIVRKWMQVQDFITENQLVNINRLLIAMSLLMGLAYFTEIYLAFSSHNEHEQSLFFQRIFGDEAVLFWTMITCNLVLPQFLWNARLIRSYKMSFVIAICINIGMWIERFLIVVGSQEYPFLSQPLKIYTPTFTELSIYLGTFGIFLFTLLLFVRLFPILPIYEVAHQKQNKV